MRRWGPDERWPCVVAEALGSGWTLIEEGLPGRTTVHDDPIEGVHMNGKTYLQPCLASHWPLDVIAVMLGANDLKPKFSLDPTEIALGVGALLYTIKSLAPPWTNAPKLLLICPAPAISSGWQAPLFDGADGKARQMAPLYKWQADRYGAAFFDAGTVVKVLPVDGVTIREPGASRGPSGDRATACGRRRSVTVRRRCRRRNARPPPKRALLLSARVRRGTA
ncbi:MAG: GDSL-type esterase/lipase family protein [Roseiarcus sp.]